MLKRPRVYDSDVGNNEVVPMDERADYSLDDSYLSTSPAVSPISGHYEDLSDRSDKHGVHHVHLFSMIYYIFFCEK